jgi:glycosyltransferase involved in cell wall biosynthesis
LDKWKNLDVILKLADMQSDVKFVIAGRKPDEKVFGKYNINSLNQNVIFTGYVTDSELASLFKNSKTFIFPSIYEGFGLPALEALCFNTPLFLSDIPVFREIYEDVATFFNPNDPNDLLRKCYNINEPDSKKREKILKNFSWDKCVENIIEIWERKM